MREFNNDFREMIVDLYKSGRSAVELANEYNIHESTLPKWRRKYDIDNGTLEVKSPLNKEDKELQKLRKELANIKLERDILKKAVSIFSKSDR
ncbi:MAG: transposase [Polaribacter sp.]|jgi:transposase